MTDVLIIMYVKTHRENGNVKLEAEIGVTLPQAKETKSHQKLKKVRKKYFLEPSEGAWPCQHRNFGLYSLQT